MYVSSRTSIISANFQRLSKVLKNFCRFAMMMPIPQNFLKSLPADVFHLASKTQNWINFPTKIPTVEQLFRRTARWVLLELHLVFSEVIMTREMFQNLFLKTYLKQMDMLSLAL